MNSQSSQPDHERIDLLLPWYVNGTLSEAEREAVQRHLAVCSECQTNVHVLERVQAGVQSGSATPITPSRFDDLLDSIDAGTPRDRWHAAAPGLAMAASIAVMLIAVTLVIGNRYPGTYSPVRYETATSVEQASPLDYVIDVQFEEWVSVQERERTLREIGVTDFSSTGDPGSYRAVLSLQATSIEALDQYTQEIEARRNVKSVSVVALQFPMR